MMLAVFVTYARVPIVDSYGASEGGPADGARRVLVALNFPVSLVAIALLGVVMARLLAHPLAADPSHRRAASAVAVLALVLCAVTIWPGVVKNDPSQVQPINALPTLGVVLVLALTGFTARVCGLGTPAHFGRWDILRSILAGGLVVVGLPWLLADLGVYIGDLPVLGAVFASKELLPPGAALPAVHLGHHHGADGALFALTALALSRAIGQFSTTRLRALLVFAVALLFVYGVANVANDAWGEQIAKRGWTSVEIPSVLWPAATPAWGVVLAITIVLHLLIVRGLRRPPARSTD
jgi:branched-subunit amino acid ABC-type transport system permease component